MGVFDDRRREPDGLRPASPRRTPRQIVSRVLLFAGLVLMLYVVVVVSRALS